MDGDFAVSHVEGFRSSEEEITNAAFIASMENAELSETYQDDMLDERRVAEGVFSEISEAASTVDASDHSFEVVGNELMQFDDDKSVTLDTIPGYDRTTHVSTYNTYYFHQAEGWKTNSPASDFPIHGAVTTSIGSFKKKCILISPCAPIPSASGFRVGFGCLNTF